MTNVQTAYAVYDLSAAQGVVPNGAKLLETCPNMDMAISVARSYGGGAVYRCRIENDTHYVDDYPMKYEGIVIEEALVALVGTNVTVRSVNGVIIAKL